MNVITPQKNVLNHSKPGLSLKKKEVKEKKKKSNNKNLPLKISHDAIIIGLSLF